MVLTGQPLSEEEAAVKIQSIYRGYNSRKSASSDETSRSPGSAAQHRDISKAVPVSSAEAVTALVTSERIYDEEEAAVKIQAMFRGYTTRQKMSADLQPAAVPAVATIPAVSLAADNARDGPEVQRPSLLPPPSIMGAPRPQYRTR
jgi:IQ calmodulin-binding motif-containing protein